jgi:hypothetical protein
MRIPLLDGRDFRPADQIAGAAMVNKAFVQEYFSGRSPIGQSFDMVPFGGNRLSFRVVGCR